MGDHIIRLLKIHQWSMQTPSTRLQPVFFVDFSPLASQWSNVVESPSKLLLHPHTPLLDGNPLGHPIRSASAQIQRSELIRWAITANTIFTHTGITLIQTSVIVHIRQVSLFGTETTLELIKSSDMFPFKMAFNTLSNIHAKPSPSRGYLHRTIALYTSPPIPSIPNAFPFAIVFTIFCTSFQVMSAFQYSSLPHIPYPCFEVYSPQISPNTRNLYYGHLLFTLPSI